MKINNQNMREKIIALYNENPEYVNDDSMLIDRIWEDEGWHDSRRKFWLKQVSSPETIRRTRAKLVEEGIVKPSEKTQEARYEEFKQARMSL